MKYPGHLTERENAVLALVAQGMTNRDIAEALVISRATVQNHLRHIFEKLGATSRLEAAVKANLLVNPSQLPTKGNAGPGKAAD